LIAIAQQLKCLHFWRSARCADDNKMHRLLQKHNFLFANAAQLL
jgi:hypothetical protein